MIGWLTVLWACRVCVFSNAAGLVLYAVAAQGRDTFADTSFNYNMWWAAWHWLWTLLFIGFLWAFPVHLVARKMVEGSDDWLLPLRARREMPVDEQLVLGRALRTRFAAPIRCVPRILGVLPFYAVCAGLVREWSDLHEAGALEQAMGATIQIQWLTVAVAINGVLFFWFLIRRRAIVSWFGRNRRIPGAGFIARMLLYRSTDKGPRAWLVANILWFPPVLLLVWAFVSPLRLSEYCPRSMLLPMLLGGGTLLFGRLARWSDRTGLPVVGLVTIAAMALTGANAPFHNIRAANSTLGQRASLDDAIKQWQYANHCLGNIKVCPDALIVATEGGASRSAFFTATVIGALFDEASNPHAMINRLFAISGVSGGAVGAAVVHAAVADWRDEGKLPCQVGRESWFGQTSDGKAPENWRGCLQLLTSGDHVTPAFVGMGFRDNLAPPYIARIPYWYDRAALLEQSWEAHYDFVHDSQEMQTDKGLRRRMGNEGRMRLLPHNPWVPLLFQHGTSVETGRRIVISEIDSVWWPGAAAEPLYPEAFDLFEMMAPQCRVQPLVGEPEDRCVEKMDGKEAVAAAPDIRLSTAAIISARFPLISPPGTIRAGAARYKDGKSGGEIVDRVVDGGVFENAGLTTARDIAAALKDKNIRTLILHINNDPRLDQYEVLPPRPPRAGGESTPRMAVDGAGRFIKLMFGTVGGPLQALYDTRGGHGAEARKLAQETVAGNCTDRTTHDCFYDINVYGALKVTGSESCTKKLDGAKMKIVSMSWWLSRPVQAYLDAQLYDDRNFKELKALQAALSQTRLGEADQDVARPPKLCPVKP